MSHALQQQRQGHRQCFMSCTNIRQGHGQWFMCCNNIDKDMGDVSRAVKPNQEHG